MLVARIAGRQRVEVVECPAPVAAPGEVLVRVHAAALPPAAIRAYRDGPTSWPVALDRQCAGVVEAVGPDVCGLEPGARVALEPTRPCLTCDTCRRGLTNLCEHTPRPSETALAELVVCPAHCAAVLPPGLSFVDGALAAPLSVSIHALRRGDMSTDETVAVLGAGVIGLGLVQALRAYGLPRVLVAEPRADRRRLAEELGATVAASAADLAPAAPLAVFDAAGTPEALAEAVDLAAPGGRLILLGAPGHAPLTLDSRLAHRKELTVHFVRAARSTLGEALRLLGTGAVSFAGYPLGEFALSEAPAAFAAAASGEPLRVILRSGEQVTGET